MVVVFPAPLGPETQSETLILTLTKQLRIQPGLPLGSLGNRTDNVSALSSRHAGHQS